MATRKKDAAALVLPDWKAVEARLKELGEIRRRVTSTTAVANAKVSPIMEKLAADTDADNAQDKRIVDALKVFTLANAHDLDGRRKVLTFGQVALRTVITLKPLADWTFDKVLDRLRELKRKAFITVKESISKEAIEAAKLSDEKLAELGLRMVEEEKFLDPVLFEVKAQPT